MYVRKAAWIENGPPARVVATNLARPACGLPRHRRRYRPLYRGIGSGPVPGFDPTATPSAPVNAVDPTLISPSNPCYDNSAAGAVAHFFGTFTASEESCLNALIPNAPIYTGSEADNPYKDNSLLDDAIAYWSGSGPFGTNKSPLSLSSSNWLLIGGLALGGLFLVMVVTR